MADVPEIDPQIEAMWREVLTTGHRSRWAAIPSSPRCTGCHKPFGGIGGVLTGLLGTRPSRKNPNWCNYCDDMMPRGGAEIDIALLFADVRGSTGLGEHLGASAFAALLNRFYKTATDVLLTHDAMIDKMVGDEVMAIFYPGVCGPGYRSIAVHTAEEMLRAMGFGRKGEPWLPLGVGVHAGPAFMGKIGTEGVHDFTALGDTVNTASRLQALAEAGEVVLSEEVYGSVSGEYPNLEQRTLTLRGREEPVAVRVLRVGTLTHA